MTIVSSITEFPPHYYRQEEVLSAAQSLWVQGPKAAILERWFSRVGVRGRHFALPLPEYPRLSGFGQSNAAWLECALDVGEHALHSLLRRAEIDPTDISLLAFTTVTGISVPSLDAQLMNRVAFSPHLKRMPLFGFGCAGGVAGVARVAEYLWGHPDQAALLLSVELCSLAFKSRDVSIAHLISIALFGDGAAALLMVGKQHPLAARGGPRVVAAQSTFFPDTERVMGWDIVDSGFQVVLSAEVPRFAGELLRPKLETFLSEHGLNIKDIGVWVVHPGGPKVMEAVEHALELDPAELAVSRTSLEEIGNISSASVLHVLDRTLNEKRQPPGTHGLMIALGPGFCAELVLLQW